jgi:threonyl-tRNA synthetase
MNQQMVMQVKAEVISFLKMLDEVYSVFSLEYSFALSTRPEHYLGEVDLWDQAEKALEEALNANGALHLLRWSSASATMRMLDPICGE